MINNCMPYFYDAERNKWGVLNSSRQDKTKQGDRADLFSLVQSPRNNPQSWGIQWANRTDTETQLRPSKAFIAAEREGQQTDLIFGTSNSSADATTQMVLTSQGQLILNPEFEEIQADLQTNLFNQISLRQNKLNSDLNWGIEWLTSENNNEVLEASLTIVKDQNSKNSFEFVTNDSGNPQKQMKLSTQGQLVLNPEFQSFEKDNFYQIILQRDTLGNDQSWGIEWLTGDNFGTQEAFIRVAKRQDSQGIYRSRLELGAGSQGFQIVEGSQSIGDQIFIKDDYVSFFNEEIDVDEELLEQRIYITSDTQLIGKSSNKSIIDLKRVPGAENFGEQNQELISPIGEVISFSSQNEIVGYDYIDNFSALRLYNYNDDRFINPQPITNALQKIDQIDGYLAKIESGGDDYHTLLASEIKTIMPDAVKEIDGKEWVDPVRLIPLLIAAIKELNT